MSFTGNSCIGIDGTVLGSAGCYFAIMSIIGLFIVGFPVKLSDIIEAIDIQSDEMTSYLNKNTGEIVTFTEDDIEAAENQDSFEDYPEWQHENINIARQFLDHKDDFIGLPTKYDIHEYEIMERFCLSLKNRQISEALSQAIKGKGAFRRFKNEIIRCSVDDKWYKYREVSIREIAVDWCEFHKIPFKKE
jgi:hypothetical protein